MILTGDILKKHIGTIEKDTNVAIIAPFWSMAKRELKKKVGAELVNGFASQDTELRDLLEAWVCWYAYSLAFPHMKLRVGNSGIAKGLPANHIAVTKWEYADSRESNIEMQDALLEMIFDYLEAEKPSAWTSTDQYASRQSRFIRSSSELQKIIPMVGKSSRFFDQLVTYIGRAEREYILDLLTEDVFEELKSKRNNPAKSATEERLIGLVQQAVAHIALYEAMPYLPLKIDEIGIRQVRRKEALATEEIADKKDIKMVRKALWTDAEFYVGKLKSYMMKVSSPTVYPTFFEIWGNVPGDVTDFSQNSHVML